MRLSKQIHSCSVPVAKVAVVAARPKAAALARAVVVVAQVANLVQERVKEVAILQPDGLRPQEVRQAAAGLTTRQKASAADA